MKNDVLNSLGSLGEVAVFAWSLLELLVTRILPLLGFLTGHFLLHCFSLAAAVFKPQAAAPRRSRRLPTRRPEDEPQEPHGPPEASKTTGGTECIGEILDELELQRQQASPVAAGVGDVPPLPIVEKQVEEAVPSSDLQNDNSVSESLTSSVKEQQASPVAAGVGDVPPLPIVEKQVGEAVPSSDLQNDNSVTGSLTSSVKKVEEQVGHVAETPELKQCDGVPTSKDNPTGSGHVQREPGQDQVNGMPASGRDPIYNLHVVGKHNSSKRLLKVCELPTIEEESHVEEWEPLDQEKGSKPSDEEAGELVQKSGSTRRKGASVRLPRVLPPSLSQIKRNVMDGSPVNLAPSYHSKRASPSIRRLASTKKSSVSYGNFLGAFRKHFLIDSS